MKVFVAERLTDYSELEILGVFSTKAAAQRACDEDIDHRGKKRGDDYEIEELEVDVPKREAGKTPG